MWMSAGCKHVFLPAYLYFYLWHVGTVGVWGESHHHVLWLFIACCLTSVYDYLQLHRSDIQSAPLVVTEEARILLSWSGAGGVRRRARYLQLPGAGICWNLSR